MGKAAPAPPLTQVDLARYFHPWHLAGCPQGQEAKQALILQVEMKTGPLRDPTDGRVLGTLPPALLWKACLQHSTSHFYG